MPHQSNPHQTLSPAPALQHLKPFVGHWQVEGQNLTGALTGVDAQLRGEQVYEWLPGNFFLLSRWNRQFDDTQHAGLGIIEYDQESRFFHSRNYNSLGYARNYKLYQEQNAWKLDGPNERATIEFAPDGNSYAEYWEISEDGLGWTPLRRLEGKRVG